MGYSKIVRNKIIIKKTHPRTQITAPITDRTNATSAKGSPNKKPNGLHSPILCLPLYSLLCLSLSLSKETLPLSVDFLRSDLRGCGRERDCICCKQMWVQKKRPARETRKTSTTASLGSRLGRSALVKYQKSHVIE